MKHKQRIVVLQTTVDKYCCFVDQPEQLQVFVQVTAMPGVISCCRPCVTQTRTLLINAPARRKGYISGTTCHASQAAIR